MPVTNLIVLLCLFVFAGVAIWVISKPTPIIRCPQAEWTILEILTKNRLIHRLEARICRLKRANHNLRDEVKRLTKGSPNG